ncbi:uncharacterized protein CLAFUR5_05941 [Fulvia fulva]|uniref:Uncharacterized protein n=1 Tax=Passalora fulva TaxID=5499 RepID=A0A9Q8LID4_PASFU|nr:uncharacterized protein CLAFUR5_05941 [Fulvia fulva]KAK4625699.1 hypothetical protein CLAFUR0_05805 [Fulvia fulva]UJO17951.1 hypothetical protein CLAFUR5_05941 [Fulvia fulva]
MASQNPQPKSFEGLPNEILELIYRICLESDPRTIGGDLTIKQYSDLKDFLRIAINARLYAIALDAFGRSRFFDDFTLSIYMSGSEEYQHLPHLRNSIFDQDREGPVIYARATNINRTHAAYVNIFNFESLSRTRHFGLFAQSILARRTKKVQFRLDVAHAGPLTSRGVIRARAWDKRFVRKMSMIIDVMSSLKVAQICHNGGYGVQQVTADIWGVLRERGIAVEEVFNPYGWRDLTQPLWPYG